MKPITFTLDFERSTKNTHRYSGDGTSGDERPMVIYIQKKDMPTPALKIQVTIEEAS